MVVVVAVFVIGVTVVDIVVDVLVLHVARMPCPCFLHVCLAIASWC